VTYLSRLRKSKSAVLLVAAAWLPYLTVCCVGGPPTGSASSSLKCHSATAVMSMASVPSGSADGAQRNVDSAAAPHDCCAGDPSSDRSPKGRACCELAGKANVTVKECVDFGAEPELVTASLPFASVCPLAETVEPSSHPGVCRYGPPLYLANASLLI